MLGAIIGDAVGSVYEFANYRHKDFPFFSRGCTPTDDSVLTCAIAEVLLDSLPIDYSSEGLEAIKAKVTRNMVEWARRYPDGGYGGRFAQWLRGYNCYQPYGSFGNGAGMRVSPVAYIAANEEELRLLSKAVTEVTHNHPEGIKGAEAIAMLTYMAIHGADKEALRKVALSYYPRIAEMDYQTVRQRNRFDETCQGSIPEAIYCLLISDSYEDCIRTAISIGGDSDTIACMAGAIAEPLFGIPTDILDAAKPYIPEEMLFLANKIKAIRP